MVAPRRATRLQKTSHRISRRTFLQTAGAGAGLLALAACGTPDTPATTPDTDAPVADPAVAPGEPGRGGILRIAFPGTPAGMLDPAQVNTNEDYHIALACFNALVKLDENLVPQGDLAESWTPSDDLLQWDFQLRQGISFHHGKEFNADDVVFTFERILDPATASPLRTVIGFVDGVERLGEHEVRFHLNMPSADLPNALTAVQARIVPSDRTDDELTSEASGTGPFRLTNIVPGDQANFERNEEYWEEGLPYLDGLRHVYISEQSTQIAALTGGQVDVLWQLSFENIPTVEASPGVRVAQAPSGLYQPIVMQVDHEPFDDVRVRQALKLCADRPGMMQVAAQGLGELGNDQPVPPINPYHAPEIEPKTQDIERARELLTEAGYPDGLDLTLHTSATRPGMVEVAVAMQEMARPAGFNISIERVPPDVYWSEYWLNDNIPFMVSNWNFRATADESLSIAFHSEAVWNESNFRRPELDALIEEARGELDEERRAELYAEAQELISEEGGSIIPFFKPVVAAMRDEVQGLEPHPTVMMWFRTAWLETA